MFLTAHKNFTRTRTWEVEAEECFFLQMQTLNVNETHCWWERNTRVSKKHTWTQRGLSFALLQCPPCLMPFTIPSSSTSAFKHKEAVKLEFLKKLGFGLTGRTLHHSSIEKVLENLVKNWDSPLTWLGPNPNFFSPNHVRQVPWHQHQNSHRYRPDIKTNIIITIK